MAFRTKKKAWNKQIIYNLSLKYKRDPRVVEYIVDYPFSFMKKRITDDVNNDSVRLIHLGVWTLKRKDLKDKIYNAQMDKLKSNLGLLVELGKFESEEIAEKELDEMSRREIFNLYSVIPK